MKPDTLNNEEKFKLYKQELIRQIENVLYNISHKDYNDFINSSTNINENELEDEFRIFFENETWVFEEAIFDMTEEDYLNN